MREELQQRDVERWLGFITFLCEVFGTMRSSTGEPFRVLVCPIYTCLREVNAFPPRPSPPVGQAVVQRCPWSMERLWLLHPWKCPRPRWAGFGPAWNSGRFPWQSVGSRQRFSKALPAQTILGFHLCFIIPRGLLCQHFTLQKYLHLQARLFLPAYCLSAC